MPFPGHHQSFLASVGDVGVLIATIIQGGEKFHKKAISLVTENMTSNEKLKIWAEGKL